MQFLSTLPTLNRSAEYQFEATDLLPRSEWLLVAMAEREFSYAHECALGDLDRLMFNLGDIGQPRGVYCVCGRAYQSEVAWLWGVCDHCDIEMQASYAECDAHDYMESWPCNHDCWEDEMGCGCPRHRYDPATGPRSQFPRCKEHVAGDTNCQCDDCIPF